MDEGFLRQNALERDVLKLERNFGRVGEDRKSYLRKGKSGNITPLVCYVDSFDCDSYIGIYISADTAVLLLSQRIAGLILAIAYSSTFPPN